MKLTEADAMCYARMINSFDASHIETLQDDSFRFQHQWIIGEISSKQNYFDHLNPQLLETKQSGTRAYAEITMVSASGYNENRVMAEGEI